MKQHHVLLLTLPGALVAATAAAATSAQQKSYPNITLSSSFMTADVFLPASLSAVASKHAADEGRSADDDEGSSEEPSAYYESSRFEHGSMIGSIRIADHTLYGTEMWRVPHDPLWPESGVGLASEYGCGDDGDKCSGKGDIANGILGYDTAKRGGAFLKIGVGALLKGSCPDCHDDDTYRFNSPYEFARQPVWRMIPSPDLSKEITIEHEEMLDGMGYRLRKTTRLDGDVLTVRSTLTNLGKKQFVTPWYSHHFFTVDELPVGPGYRLDLGLSEPGLKSTPSFTEPGVGSWAEPLQDYARIETAPDGSISVAMKKVLPDDKDVRLKAEFLDQNVITFTDGSFAMRAPNGVSVLEKIPEIQTQSRNPFMYKYNVYIERTTLSPEPMLLLYLGPNESTTWTQHLKFRVGAPLRASMSEVPVSLVSGLTPWQRLRPSLSSGSGAFVAVCSLAVALYAGIFWNSRRRHREAYTRIPDEPYSGTIIAV